MDDPFLRLGAGDGAISPDPGWAAYALRIVAAGGLPFPRETVEALVAGLGPAS